MKNNEFIKSSNKPWGGIVKVPLVWCNGGSSQGLIALTLCQETLLQQKNLREKDREG